VVTWTRVRSLSCKVLGVQAQAIIIMEEFNREEALEKRAEIEYKLNKEKQNE
jgi:hypothetical protein